MHRTNGTHTVNRLQVEMDRLFGDFFRGFPGQVPQAGAFPALNVWQEDGAVFVEAELPGLSREDLDITLKSNELSIRGERQPAGAETFHLKEHGYGKFSRLVRLPVQIDADKVEATFKNGVLTLRLPVAEAAKPRKIEVKSA